MVDRPDVQSRIADLDGVQRETRQQMVSVGNWLNTSITAACALALLQALAPISTGRVCAPAAYAKLPTLLTEALTFAFIAAVMSWAMLFVVLFLQTARQEALRLSINKQLREGFREGSLRFSDKVQAVMALLIIALPVHIWLYYEAVSRLARAAAMAYSDPAIINAFCRLPQ